MQGPVSAPRRSAGLYDAQRRRGKGALVCPGGVWRAGGWDEARCGEPGGAAHGAGFWCAGIEVEELPQAVEAESVRAADDTGDAHAWVECGVVGVEADWTWVW